MTKYRHSAMDRMSARLAVVLPSPEKLNPAGDQKFVTKRAAMVYDIMVRRGIVVEDYDTEDDGQADDDAAPVSKSDVKTDAVAPKP